MIKIIKKYINYLYLSIFAILIVVSYLSSKRKPDNISELFTECNSFAELTNKCWLNNFPKWLEKDDLATKAVQLMEEYSITSLVVSANGKKIDGIIHLHDLLKAGII